MIVNNCPICDARLPPGALLLRHKISYMSNAQPLVGQSLLILEDPRFLPGRGTYVDDIRLDKQTYAVVVRAPVAHAKLKSANADAARARPGVALILRGRDLADQIDGLGSRIGVRQLDGSGIAPVKAPVMAHDRVLYVGQPVALVVADTLAKARDAAELVEIEYDELPVVTTGADALADGAPQLHDEAPRNRAYPRDVGDREATESAFANASHVTKIHYHCHRIAATPMEPRAVIADYDGDS